MLRTRIFDGLEYYWYRHCSKRDWAKREVVYARKHGYLARMTPSNRGYDIWRRRK